ncbi:unnamed protein product [Plutella xylostella]|uniref:(diamondback moth) hypothetical protein n=1 Tax=Plutella xylostella TaxID=51655 RepID=A0A8S4CVP4_PLUXY|nr:unnamed protein product [Plutella xylostella]
MSNENEDIMEASSAESEDDSMDEGEEGENEGGEEEAPKTYLPGQPLKEDEHLVCDQSAYVMLHQAQTGAPCLSFDIVDDNLGPNRDAFPMTAYMVAGTQASSTHLNNLIVIKMSNLHSTSKPENDESDSEEDDDDEEEDEEKKPQMSFAFVKHAGCVNRIRATNYKNSVLAATWSELGRVDIWNITQQLQAVDDPTVLERYNLDVVKNPVKPIYSFTGHQQEGFGMAWCPTEPGVLATGDCRRDIHIWRPNEGGTWDVDQRPLVGHTSSVEDIQWSPNERNVLASCSVDKTIRIWDTRAAPQKACMLTAENAHQSDINVISWNNKEPFIASVVSTTGRVSKTSAGNQMSQLSLSTKINLDPQNQPPLSEDDWQTVPVLSQQSRYKRKKQNQSPSPEKDVPLTNRYSSLHVDDTSTIKSVPNLVGMKPKQPSKPPPIFLYGVEDLNQLTFSIEEVVGQDDYSYKVVSKNQLILSSKTADIYKKLIEHIREKGLIGHTFTRKEDRSVKFFIKNLHHTTPKDVIIKAIEDTGNKVRGEVVNIRRRGTKEPYNIFIVNVEQNENNKLVKEIRYIFHQRVLIEDPRKSTIIPQCTRCQKYGHTKK